MKKSIISLIAIAAFSLHGLAQGDLEALRYSQSFPFGTARSLSMGGAFGALGGDFSSLSINPAGIGVYRGKELTITPTFYHDRTNTTFLGNQREDITYRLNLDNLGYVMNFPLRGSSSWKFINLGIGYNQNDNYHRNMLIEGVNYNSTLLDYFAYMAFNTTPDELYAFEEGIAWDAWLISDTLVGSDIYYETLFSDYGNRSHVFGQNQRRTVNTRGTKGEYVISLGTNYNDKLYIGGTFGINRIYYTEEINHIEEDLEGNVPDLDYFRFSQMWTTQGTGYTFKLGVIYRPIPILRIGTAIHLPTFYKLDEEFYTYVEAYYDTPRPGDTGGSLIWDAESPDGYNEFELTTPFRFVGSVALQIEKLALISLDYEYIDYSTARLRHGPEGYNFTGENEAISQAFNSASNIRFGAEFRLGTLSLRGGAAYYGKPYVAGELNEDAYNLFLTGGLGIRTRNFFADVGYLHAMHEEQYMMYNMSELEPATVETRPNKLMATFGFRF